MKLIYRLLGGLVHQQNVNFGFGGDMRSRWAPHAESEHHHPFQILIEALFLVY
jgi:hypothetical protein